MSTLSLQSEQNDLIRRILDVKDLSLLKKIRNMLNSELEIEDSLKDDSVSYMTRSEIENHIAKACCEAKQIADGKLEPINVEDLLDEL